jgi:hypothetical protein
MKPRIKPLPRTGDATQYLVDGKVIVIPACLMAMTRKRPLQLLAEQLKKHDT